MMQLFIEGKEADINQEFSTLVTYAIDDIKDFGSKNTSFSKTTILPGTKRNNLLFNNIFEVTGSQDYDSTKSNVGLNFNAAISARCYVFNDVFQCLKGTLRVLEIINDRGLLEYEVFVVGELGGFVSALGNSKLTGNTLDDGSPDTSKDLNFSTYDNIYNISNIVTSWTNTNNGSGVYYPLIDYGNYSIGKHNWNYGTFRPALFLKEYIDKIFTNTGYTYQCDLFNTTRFKGLIIPHNQKKLTNKQTTELDVIQTSGVTYTSTGITAENIAYNALTILGNFTASGTGNTIFTFGAGEPFIGVAKILVNVTNTNAFGPPFYLRLFINSIQVGTYNLTLGVHNIEFPVTVNVGDVVETKVVYNGGTSKYVTLSITEFQIIATDSTHPVTINLGEVIHINSCIPANILQKDLISSVCKLFNLMVFEDQNKDKHLVISPFIDYYNASNGIDWTNKVDRNSPIKIKPMSELTARYYDFAFKKDSDYWNELYSKRYNLEYGSYRYDSNYEFANETQKVELIFSGTPIVGYDGEDKVYSTIFKRTGTTTIVEENVDSNIRILQAKKVTGVTSWNILADDGVTVLHTSTDYPYAGHFDDPDSPTNDIQFGVPNELFFTLITGAININQFNVYWSSYMAEITHKDSRLMTCKAKLKLSDISNLDFSKLIYIDGALFRLNKIIDFNTSHEDTCEIELVKVINRIY